MAWKHYECQQIDEILAILNIPTRQEVDRMNYRLQQMRRESKMPRNGISEKLIAELYKEINTLKSEVAQLKSHPQPANSSRRSSRKKMSSTSLTELHPASKDVASNSNDEPQNGGGE